MFAKLAGARTYILAVAASIVGVYMSIDDLLTFIGVADLPDVPTYVLVWLGAGTAATLRSAINK